MVALVNSIPILISISLAQLQSPEYLSSLIVKYSNEYQLKPQIIAAIIWQESRGKPWAIRYEHGFYQRYLQDKNREDLSGFVPLKIPTLNSEKRARAFSWGAMQIMGETARSIGYAEEYLSTLCFPEENIKIGCLYLRHLLNDYAGLSEDEQYRKALLRYNGGGNLNYPAEIIAHVTSETYKNILIS
jgi:soluble lytic murein transglycosylase-like protein